MDGKQMFASSRYAPGAEGTNNAFVLQDIRFDRLLSVLYGNVERYEAKVSPSLLTCGAQMFEIVCCMRNHPFCF